MNKISTALCSYGMSGLVFHGPLLETHEGFSITKILERHKNVSDGKHPEAILVRDFDEILNDPKIELVIINTPDYLHFEMAKQALEAGKHIIIEKPFTLNSKDADELIDLASRKNLMLSVFQNRRWDGDFLTVQKVINDGQLGRLVSFECNFDRFRNFKQHTWKEEKSLGAGTLYNLGSHMIDQALQLFGMPEYLYADVRGLRSGAEIDDSFDIQMYYENVKCFVRGSYLVKEPGPRYILHGTHGSFLKFGLDPQEEDLKAGKKPSSLNWGAEKEETFGILNSVLSGEDTRIKIPTLPGNYHAYYDNIYKHLRNNTELSVKAEEARDVIRIIEAAYTSSREKRTVKL